MSLTDDVTAVAVLKALRDTVDAEYQAARCRVLNRLRTARADMWLTPMRMILPEGTLAATTTMIYPAPTVVLVDDEAVTTPIAGNDPNTVQSRVRVRASWQQEPRSQQDPNAGPVANPHTGEVVAGPQAILAQRPAPDGTEEITRAWRRGELDLRELLCLDAGQP
jgi:hypothetical protein